LLCLARAPLALVFEPEPFEAALLLDDALLVAGRLGAARLDERLLLCPLREVDLLGDLEAIPSLSIEVLSPWPSTPVYTH
jgi:hypothetical protein